MCQPSMSDQNNMPVLTQAYSLEGSSQVNVWKDALMHPPGQEYGAYLLLLLEGRVDSERLGLTVKGCLVNHFVAEASGLRCESMNAT